jgi:PAT family beta-lactamase induction signal transducer AmpG
VSLPGAGPSAARADHADRAPHPYRSRRVRVLALLGFSSGVPYLLTGQTLGAWMTSAHVDLTTIGAFSLVGVPYNFKWAWAPLVDRYRLPFLGRRRGWLLVLQLALIAAIATMGVVDPRAQPATLATLAAVVAFLSASQDIVVDAFTADTLRADERAAGSALTVGSYRAAMLLTGAASLRLAEVVPWRVIYGGCAALMLIGVAGTLLAVEPDEAERRPASLAAAFVTPLVRLVAQPRILVVLGFVACFRFGEHVGLHFLVPYLRDGVGFSFADIALYYQLVGFAGVVAGGVLGGWLVPRLGVRRALAWFGAAGALTNLGWALLASLGPSWPALGLVVIVDNLASSMAATAFVAYLWSRCEPAVSATQYAILTSLSSLAARFLGFAGAVVVERAGWSVLWLATAVVVLPALVLVRWLPVDDRDHARARKSLPG